MSSGAADVRVARITVRTLAHGLVVAWNAEGVDATLVEGAQPLALADAQLTAVVVRTLEVAKTLRLAPVDGVSVRHKVVLALAECDVLAVHLTASVGAAGRGVARVHS